MAEGKKTFIFYSDWINMVREMPDADAGELLKHVLSYVNDEEPTTENLLVRMAFGHMKPMLKHDLDKWEKQLQKYSEMGKKSAKKRALDASKAKATQVEHRSTQVERTSTVNDNVNVNNNNSEIVVVADSYDEYKDQISKEPNSTWLENFYRVFKLRDKTLSLVMDDFIQHKRCLPGPPPNNIKEFKIHFYNWCLKVDPIGKLNSYKKHQLKEKGSL